jgi:hypothetical protein
MMSHTFNTEPLHAAPLRSFVSIARAGTLTSVTSENAPRTRRVFYDFEFLETGRTIDVISVGMVDDGGAELYLINQNAPWSRIVRDEPWLRDHVLPSLPMEWSANRKQAYPDPDHPAVTPREDIPGLVRSFLVDGVRPVDQGAELELWAWYGAFDHVALSWLWGRMIDHPRGVPMFTCDIRQWQQQLGRPALPEQPAGEHNALDDARHNRVRWALLAEFAAGRLTHTHMAAIASGDAIPGPTLLGGTR